MERPKGFLEPAVPGLEHLPAWVFLVWPGRGVIGQPVVYFVWHLYRDVVLHSSSQDIRNPR